MKIFLCLYILCFALSSKAALEQFNCVDETICVQSEGCRFYDGPYRDGTVAYNSYIRVKKRKQCITKNGAVQSFVYFMDSVLATDYPPRKHTDAEAKAACERMLTLVWSYYGGRCQ
jgi:hypothetical protein